MPQSDLSTWLQFSLQQIAAESYLDGINWNDPLAVIGRLVGGNNRPGFAEINYTRLTQTQAAEFVQRYVIVDHHANDATGFSATLLYDRDTNSYTLSFRSTEYKDQSAGGDWERDGLSGADGEIKTYGFAFGQLAAMEEYYQTTVKNLLPTGAVLNVTGYSLGGHLATVFTELHASEVDHTYLFNAAGRGSFTVALPTESAQVQRRRKTNLERSAA